MDSREWGISYGIAGYYYLGLLVFVEDYVLNAGYRVH